MMMHMPRVALEIKSVGLYDLILQDVQKIMGKERVKEIEVLNVISEHPEILEDYKQINVEYNLSNIHIRDIDAEHLKNEDLLLAQKINQNLAQLRELEKYTLDFEQSSTLVIIFSIEFIVLFSVQYFIILLNLKEWQWELYSLFATSIAFAWWYAKSVGQKYERNNETFQSLYTETEAMIEQLDATGAISKADLVIADCDEHV